MCVFFRRHGVVVRAPQDRYVKLLPQFNETVWGFWNKYFANDVALRDGIFLLADTRGPENTEQQREVRSSSWSSQSLVQHRLTTTTPVAPTPRLARTLTNTPPPTNPPT